MSAHKFQQSQRGGGVPVHEREADGGSMVWMTRREATAASRWLPSRHASKRDLAVAPMVSGNPRNRRIIVNQ